MSQGCRILLESNPKMSFVVPFLDTSFKGKGEDLRGKKMWISWWYHQLKSNVGECNNSAPQSTDGEYWNFWRLLNAHYCLFCTWMIFVRFLKHYILFINYTKCYFVVIWNNFWIQRKKRIETSKEFYFNKLYSNKSSKLNYTTRWVGFRHRNHLVEVRERLQSWLKQTYIDCW